MPDPIYTAANTNPAYQLNWSLSVFWAEPPPDLDWLDPLRAALDADGIRILEHRVALPKTSQFLVSTRPDAAPEDTVRLVKGRLQHLVRTGRPKALRRNYHTQSVGSANTQALEQYIGSQVGHHRMADETVQQELARYQFHDPGVRLSEPRRTSHAELIYNLHIAFVNEGRRCDIDHDALQAKYDMLLRASAQKDHLLSRASVLADHVHIAIGCRLCESPQDVALSYMNNLAFAQGMRPVLKYSYYVGTFGPYDLNAIRMHLAGL